MNTYNEFFNENTLSGSEFAALLKHASCGICAYKIELGKEPRMMYMTDGFCDICEASKDDIYHAYDKDRLFGVHHKYHEQVNDTIAKAIVTDNEQEVTYMAVSLKGQKKWCTLRISPDKRDDGTIMLFGTFFDVTKHMRTQRNLNDLIHNIPGAVCLYRYSGHYLEPIIISNRYSDMLGTDASDVLNNMKDMNFKHVHPDDLANVKEQVLTALSTTHKLDYTYRSFNEKVQKYIWINVQGNVIPQEDGTSYAYVLYTDITRDKEIEQKLRANEQIIEAATQNAEVWYWNCHWRQNIAYMGERFQKDFSVPAKLHDFCKQMFNYNIVDSAFRDIFTDMCKNIIFGRKEAEAVVKGYLADGSCHWMKFKLCNIFDENGIAQEAVGIMHLVDDMKEMERKYEIEKRHAKEDKNLLAHCCINVSNWNMIEYSGSYVFDINDTDMTIDNIGRSIASEATDIEIKNQILRLHNRTYLLNSFANGITEHSLEYQRTLTNGKCIWVRSTFHLVNDQSGTDILLFEYCYNINVKKTMNILMEFAVNDDYDLMGFVNMHDKMTIMIYGKNSYNPHNADIVEDDYDKSLIDFTNNAVIPEEREQYLKTANLAYVKSYLESNDNLEFYFNTRNADGNLQTKKVRYLKYRDDDNSVIFIQSDITQLIMEQKKSQEALEKALTNAKIANNAKTVFLSQMSHEIRTPMNAIIGMTKLAEQTDDKTELTQYLNQIDSSSQYLLGIINDILDMSRIESGKSEIHLQWVDEYELIMECIDMLKPAMNKKKINFIYPDMTNKNNIYFKIDPMRVQQIYMNLLNNAIKFTPEHGTIEITIEHIYLNNNQGIDRVQIMDTGCGMSADFLERIFNPFEMEENEYSSSVQGTGLGLALVKSFIDKMGGNISVTSELGKGSTFIFEIPYKTKIHHENHTNNIKESIGDLDNKRILLVDDHPLNREIAKKLLENKNATVITAVNGHDACEIFSNSAINYFDAILMDIRMPIMNGLEATNHIRNVNRSDAVSIPIIAMTANAFDDDAQKSIDAGMNAHLAKPIEPDKLMKTLSHFIKKND